MEDISSSKHRMNAAALWAAFQPWDWGQAAVFWHKDLPHGHLWVSDGRSGGLGSSLCLAPHTPLSGTVPPQAHAPQGCRLPDLPVIAFFFPPLNKYPFCSQLPSRCEAKQARKTVVGRVAGERHITHRAVLVLRV